MTQLTDEDLRRYLLGTLPEAQTQALEEEYFGNREALERVRGVEDDLLDDYAAGRLTPAERQRLERRWAASPRQRERLLTAQALRLANDRLGAADAARVPAGPPAPPGWRSRAGLAPLQLAAVLLLSLGVFWTWRAQRPRPHPAQGSASTPDRPSPAPPGPTPQPSRSEPARQTVMVFALAPVVERSGPGARPLRVPAHARTVRLELQGEPESVQAAGGSALVVELATVEGRPVWAGRAERPAAGHPALWATLELPSERLAPGDYILSVSLGRDGPTLQRYFLSVRR